jgi:predicted lipid-binding transport protein (Tim44 family)
VKRPVKKISALSVLSFTALLAVFAQVAFARMGGGHSYSGGHSYGGGSSYSGGSGYGGSGGGGLIIDLIDILIRIVIYQPIIGVPLVIFIIYIVYKYNQGEEAHSYISGTTSSSDGQYKDIFKNIGVDQKISELTALDPNFSEVLFLDFAYSLFVRAHMTRGAHRTRDLSTYFSDPVLLGFESISQSITEVQGVVVGAAQIRQITILDQVSIVVHFEANYTESTADHANRSWYTDETWTFVRAKNVVSKTPDKITQLNCPACGAPLAQGDEGKCPTCGKRNDTGFYDWFVKYRSSTREERGPLLTSDVAEEGTDLPTLIDPNFPREERKLVQQQPDFSWEKFSQRVELMYFELEKAWTEKKWEKARPYQSDRLFQSHLYWINAYQKQGLTNVLKDIKLDEQVLAKITQDRFYTSITVRVYGSMIDYTAKASGEVVCGSTSKRREFSEYWTLMRSTHYTAPKTDSQAACPSCGAPLNLNMSGVCQYCHTKVTTGNFDWVLSEIEQDEAYAG